MPLTMRFSTRPPTTASSDIHRCYARGFYGIHTISYYLSSSSHQPSLFTASTGCSEGLHPCFVLCYVGWGCLCPESIVRNLQIQTPSSFV
jgi:hypothetical protein